MPAVHDGPICSVVRTSHCRISQTPIVHVFRPCRSASPQVDRVDKVIRRGRNENQTAGRNHRASIVRGADSYRQHRRNAKGTVRPRSTEGAIPDRFPGRSEEHTSELQSLMRISYAVFCLKKKINHILLKIYNIISTIFYTSGLDLNIISTIIN